MKQFLRVYRKLADKEPIHINVARMDFIDKGDDDGDMIVVGYEWDGTAQTGFITYEDWVEFQRVHVIGVPKRTTHNDIHLGSIAQHLETIAALLKKQSC